MHGEELFTTMKSLAVVDNKEVKPPRVPHVSQNTIDRVIQNLPVHMLTATTAVSSTFNTLANMRVYSRPVTQRPELFAPPYRRQSLFIDIESWLDAYVLDVIVSRYKHKYVVDGCVSLHTWHCGMGELGDDEQRGRDQYEEFLLGMYEYDCYTLNIYDNLTEFYVKFGSRRQSTLPDGDARLAALIRSICDDSRNTIETCGFWLNDSFFAEQWAGSHAVDMNAQKHVDLYIRDVVKLISDLPQLATWYVPMKWAELITRCDLSEEQLRELWKPLRRVTQATEGAASPADTPLSLIVPKLRHIKLVGRVNWPEDIFEKYLVDYMLPHIDAMPQVTHVTFCDTVDYDVLQDRLFSLLVAKFPNAEITPRRVTFRFSIYDPHYDDDATIQAVLAFVGAKQCGFQVSLECSEMFHMEDPPEPYSEHYSTILAEYVRQYPKLFEYVSSHSGCGLSVFVHANHEWNDLRTIVEYWHKARNYKEIRQQRRRRNGGGSLHISEDGIGSLDRLRRTNKMWQWFHGMPSTLMCRESTADSNLCSAYCKTKGYQLYKKIRFSIETETRQLDDADDEVVVEQEDNDELAAEEPQDV